jgi:hypothetical protein
MSSFLSFAQLDLSNEDSLFNNPVMGSSMLPPGKHDVTIKSVEPVESTDKKAKLKFVFESDNGQTMSHYVFVFQEKKPSVLSVEFQVLLLSVFGSQTESLKFTKALVAKPMLLQALTGMRVLIDVQESKRGYTVTSFGDQLHVVDAGDGAVAPILDQLQPPTFENYDAVKKWVEEQNAANPALKLYRAYPRVKNYAKHSGGVDANLAALQTALSATAGTSASNSALASQLLG